MNRTLIALALAAASTAALGQSYPARTVRVIVPYAPGGNTDFTARVVAQKLTDVFGQQIVVENRPGGGSTVAAEFVVLAPKDGYTLFVGTIAQAFQVA